MKIQIPIESPAGARPGLKGQLRVTIRAWT